MTNEGTATSRITQDELEGHPQVLSPFQGDPEQAAELIRQVVSETRGSQR
jgi:hypothetical protein